ncbi:MAG: hypothetical protein J3Q66DRAFT_364632 [Benniella sp.]|nr:MAG: hypothetical protein J3Q66DRAFT_364632 [Benniella sp.]
MSFSDSAPISGKPPKMTTLRLSSPLSQRHHGVFLSRLLFVPKIQLHYKAENNLEPKDIGHCTICNREWYAPYRFQSVQLFISNPPRTSFLFDNSHHIRRLGLNLANFENFDGSHCTRLQSLGLVYQYDDASDDDDSGDSFNNAIPNKTAHGASLIQRNPELCAFTLLCGRRFGMRPISLHADSILNALAGHAFLETIESTLEMTCLVFRAVLSHLPPQLWELEIAGYVEHARHQAL